MLSARVDGCPRSYDTWVLEDKHNRKEMVKCLFLSMLCLSGFKGNSSVYTDIQC